MAGKLGPLSREKQFEAEIAALTQVAAEGGLTIRIRATSDEGRLALYGPQGVPHRRRLTGFEALSNNWLTRARLAALAIQGLRRRSN